MGGCNAGWACRRARRAQGQGWAPGGDARGRAALRPCPTPAAAGRPGAATLAAWGLWIRARRSLGRSPGSGAGASGAGEVEGQPPGAAREPYPVPTLRCSAPQWAWCPFAAEGAPGVVEGCGGWRAQRQVVEGARDGAQSARDTNAYFSLPPSSGGEEVCVEEEAGRPEA